MSWLDFLPIEIKEVDEIKDPTQEIKDGDILHGVVPEALRPLYTLHRATSRQMELLQVEQKFEGKDEQRGKICELHFKSHAMQLIFWIEVYDALRLWSTPGNLELRVDWQVVTAKPAPAFPFFRFLGGGPQE